MLKKLELFVAMILVSIFVAEAIGYYSEGIAAFSYGFLTIYCAGITTVECIRLFIGITKEEHSEY